MPTPLQLIVGLGNPGPDYHHSRHNAGADLVALLADQHRQPLSNTPKFFGLSGRILSQGAEVRLLIPTTFMNLSGKAVLALAQFYKIAPEAILVVHDELDLAPGTARLKQGGGHGGHNGLRDIISVLGNNFARLRIGIGHPGDAKRVADYVLKKAPQAEYQLIETALDNSLGVIDDLCQGQWDRAVRNLHTSA